MTTDKKAPLLDIWIPRRTKGRNFALLMLGSNDVRSRVTEAKVDGSLTAAMLVEDYTKHKVLKNERRRSNLNLTPHTTVFHQFPLSNDCSWLSQWHYLHCCLSGQHSSLSLCTQLLFFKQQIQRPPQHHPSIIELPQWSPPIGSLKN